MHIGKLMARLNPKTVQFGTGSGGVPELTPQDIAGALAFVPAGLGRELLCRTWWPDGAQRTKRELQDMLASAIRDEWIRRESVMLSAMTAVALYGSKAQAQYAQAHEQRWPAPVQKQHGLPVRDDRYGRVCDAVIEEACGRHLCPTCGGRGEVAGANGVHRNCPTCDGEASAKITHRQRADACDIDWTTYRQGRWSAVYEWALEMCAEAYQAAYAAMTEACA